MIAANSPIMQHKQTYLHFAVKMQIFKDQARGPYSYHCASKR